MTTPRILIADDEPAIANGLSAILGDDGYDIEAVGDGQKALDRLTTDTFAVVLADLKMPKLDGLQLLKELQARQVATECIIITGQATVDSAVQAIREGAYDYIEKPLTADKLTRLKAVIPKAIEKHRLQEQNRELTSKLTSLTHYGELTGQSEGMRSLYEVLDKVAPSHASVLIFGESGTGKELVARAIHTKSDRVKGPFLAINCAALPKDILENELFGHEKGAFTGSTNEKPGAFEMASGGTLFLDELGEMALDIQVKLLRALETRTIRRLGGKREIPVDIRIVGATNKDLQKAIADKEFREDLFYRLAVVELYLPPLRERAGDIQLLANEFLGRFAKQNAKKVTGFDQDAWNWILAYHWPGNVRELKNAVERAVIMTRGTTITAADITPRHLRVSGEMPASLTIPVGTPMQDARRQLVLRTFASTAGDVDRTAKLLGVSTGEVRRELVALLEGGDGAAAGAERSASIPAAEEPPVVAPSGPGVPSASRLPEDRIVKSVAGKSAGAAPAKEKDVPKKRR